MIVMCYFRNLLSAIHNTQLSGKLRGVDYANLRAAWHWLEVKETFVLGGLLQWPVSRPYTHHRQQPTDPSHTLDTSVKPRLMWAAAIHSRGNLSEAAACTAGVTCCAATSTPHFLYASLQRLVVSNSKRVGLSVKPTAIDFSKRCAAILSGTEWLHQGVKWLFTHPGISSFSSLCIWTTTTATKKNSFNRDTKLNYTLNRMCYRCISISWNV